MSSHHGNTPAAWSGVAVSTLGFVIAAIGLMLSPISMTFFWVGMVLAILGLPVFMVMTKMGLGDH